MFYDTFFSYSTLITLQSRRDTMSTSERLLKDRAHPRFNMVNCQLRPNGVGEERLLQAFETVPMEDFVPPAIQSLVYSDANLILTSDQPVKRWLLAPITLGKLLQLASIKASDKVLIVGCNTGYGLALVAKLAAQVVGLESDEALAKQASTYVQDQGLTHVKVVKGILNFGCPQEAPFDVILIEGCVAGIPEVLSQQLSPLSGRLVTVINEDLSGRQISYGKGTLITKTGKTYRQTSQFDASCPNLPEFAPTREFQL